MNVFVAGSTGAIGRVLVPQLVEKGHEVVALVRNDRKAQALLAVGAKPPYHKCRSGSAGWRSARAACR